MHRRTLLSSATAAVATFGAGCLGDGGSTDGEGDDAGDDSSDDAASDSDDARDSSDDAGPGAGTWPLTGYDAGKTRATDASGPRDAEPAWNARGGHDEAGPIVADGTAFTSTGDAVVAIDVASGERRSGHPLDGVAEQPLGIVDDLLLVLENYSTLHGYERASGERRWTFDPEAARNYTIGVDAAYGRSVTESTLVAVDAATGDRRWSIDVENVNAPVAAAGALTYVVDGGVRVVEDGTERGAWSADWRINTIVADEDAAFVATDETSVVKVLPDGSEAWSISPFGFGNVVALTDETLFVSGTAAVQAVDRATGEVRSIGDSVAPAKYVSVGSEALYGVGDGYLTAWDRATGEQRWQHQLEDEAAYGPVVLEDLVLVHWTAGSRNQLQAFEAV